MAKLRLLFGLFLVAAGASFAGLALSGYYKPLAGQPAVAASAVSTDAAQYFRFRSKQRFVARDKPVVVMPTKQSAEVLPWRPKASVPPPRKTKPQAAKAKGPQQMAAQWPWNLFGN
jgi:hypothetical protein